MSTTTANFAIINPSIYELIEDLVPFQLPPTNNTGFGSGAVQTDANGKLHALPPTVVTPKAASYYDYRTKQNDNGAHFHPVHETDSALVQQAEYIAEDVYRSLRMNGIVTIDMMAHDGAVDVLDVNTIPSFHSASPIHHQLKHAGIHPENFLSGLFE